MARAMSRADRGPFRFVEREVLWRSPLGLEPGIGGNWLNEVGSEGLSAAISGGAGSGSSKTDPKGSQVPFHRIKSWDVKVPTWSAC